MGDQIAAYRWVLAYATLALLLVFLAKWRAGYTVIYYLAVLVLIFLLLTQYQGITVILSPFTQFARMNQPKKA